MVERGTNLEESEAVVMTTIEISCPEVWHELSNFVEEAIDPELRRRMEAHFKDCAHCRAVLDGTRNVIQLVCDDRVFDLPQGFSERLKKRIDSEP
jgi:hypothetical protein